MRCDDNGVVGGVDQTHLVVPVPAAEALVRLAHITVLAPFLPLQSCTDAVLAEVGALFDRRRTFSFRLNEVAVFPGDVVYLAPEPSEVFVELTDAAVAAFPPLLPYGGRFGDVIPHLTVGRIESPEMEGELVALAQRAVPIDAVARDVALIQLRADGFETVATFPFAAS
jgi:2'-5' RNA ligase